jgi:hypothetical protein
MQFQEILDGGIRNAFQSFGREESLVASIREGIGQSRIEDSKVDKRTS